MSNLLGSAGHRKRHFWDPDGIDPILGEHRWCFTDLPRKTAFNNSLASAGTLQAGSVWKIFQCHAFSPYLVHDPLADSPRTELPPAKSTSLPPFQHLPI